MPETLTLPKAPSQQSWQEQRQPRTAVARFGDGYEQRVMDGMNADLLTVSFSLDNITTSDRATLDAFLQARGGWDAFYWTMPNEASSRLWVCSQWSFAGSQASLWNGSLSFREVPA